jgi:hypothetical protein
LENSRYVVSLCFMAQQRQTALDKMGYISLPLSLPEKRMGIRQVGTFIVPDAPSRSQ